MHALTLATILASTSILNAQEWHSGAYSHEPNPILRITQTLAESKVDELTPKVSKYDDKKWSYHLSSVRYLGGISRSKQYFTVATALFIRSSPEGSDMPPARGHGFILLLDQDYKIASYCRIDFPDQIELLDSKLYRLGSIPSQTERSLVGDLTLSDILSRSRGFLIDGDGFLPYPFLDRIEQSAPQNQTKANNRMQATGTTPVPDP